MGTTDSADGRQPRGVSSHGPFGKTLAIKAARVRADIAFALTDALVVVAAYVIALALRLLDPGVSDRYWPELMAHLPLLVVLHIGANVVTGAYGHVWEHASIAEAKQVLFSNLSVLTVMVVVVAMQSDHPIPLSTLILGTAIATAGMGLVRFRSRMFSYRRMASAPRRARAIVVGTNRAAAVFAREASPSLEILGFVETVETERERWLAGTPIIGTIDDLEKFVVDMNVEQVIVVGGTDELVRRIVDLCLGIDVRLRIVPDPAAILSRTQGAVDVRDIEVTDLLPRPTVQTDLVAVRELLVGKRILITGGGGSIGSEIVRQVVQFAPSAVYALDRDETLLHEMLLSLGSRRDEVNPVLCDIRDYDALERHILQIRPEVVFHAAALKHVPVLEAHPDEAQKTNVRGTVNVLDALRQAGGVERFVLISTDKAVRPSSVMGASKRVAEMVVQQEAMRSQSGIFTSVRFGNVLGSRGSVVPTFIRQIQAGGPVTITDPEMTRYFMTVDEAVQLVLQSAAMAQGGEVFVLDMGEPVRIYDLARRLIRLAGLVPDRDVTIQIVGTRPGEKLSESLAHGELIPTLHPRVNTTRPPSPGPITMYDFVTLLDRLAAEQDMVGVREGLRDLATHEWDGFEVITLEDPEKANI
ncbi:MAG TPA: SDR family NAD(P)-dependent oxidoreductase [Acidimicrobiia bacterium]|nr:SDR family NAD(P)-dependent oxidoreductase [Acidimicrobiia bacterium]